MDDAEMKADDWKGRVREEVIEYWLNVVYLTLVFASFTVYQRLVLASHGITYTNYWFALIEGLILGKVIMVGGVPHIGRGLESKPLIYPTLYKTVVFTILVAAFKVIEYTVKGLFAGEGITGGLVELAAKEYHIVLANSLVVFIALIPFFAFKELGRVLGRKKIATLFFWPSNAS